MTAPLRLTGAGLDTFTVPKVELSGGGEVVNYEVTPIYGTNAYPASLAITARGSDGFGVDILLHNRDDTDGTGRMGR